MNLLELLYSSYKVGVTLIIISLLSFLWRAYRVKNTIEVDALVLSTEVSKWPSETGDNYYATFQYVVDGKEYIKRCDTRGTQYYVGTPERRVSRGKMILA